MFRLPAKVDYRAMPWVTYTDPELAHVGLSEAEARRLGQDVQVLRWPFAENDRAQAEPPQPVRRGQSRWPRTHDEDGKLMPFDG